MYVPLFLPFRKTSFFIRRFNFLKQNTAENNVSNFFMFGYLIGEHNFVGEWRIAADNPLNPTWAGPFALSRKID